MYKQALNNASSFLLLSSALISPYINIGALRASPVTDAAFEKVVLKSTLPVVVDFWAPWCGPCRMVAPILDKIAKEKDGKVIFAKVNTDENPEWAMKYGVQGIPTMLFISKGVVVQKQVGALPENLLRQVVDEFELKVSPLS